MAQPSTVYLLVSLDQVHAVHTDPFLAMRRGIEELERTARTPGENWSNTEIMESLSSITLVQVAAPGIDADELLTRVGKLLQLNAKELTLARHAA